MSKGFLWFAINNDKNDYMELSFNLAKSLKIFCQQNKVCVITNENTKISKACEDVFDDIRILTHDDSVEEQWKLSNEYKAFSLSPFTHTIKLEADMLVTHNIDFWWNYLCQDNMIFSYDCYNHRGDRIKDVHYRELFQTNGLPNIYSGLTYFRKSKYAQEFYNLVGFVFKNWNYVKENVLINCHDEQATTDVAYALANKILDPLQQNKKDYDWFKFVHNKDRINDIEFIRDGFRYLNPVYDNNNFYIGPYRQSRLVHYHDKRYREILN
jgi:hypothetical protein